MTAGTTVVMQLELSPEETRTLIEILDSTLGDLRMEISDTDSFDYRQQLKSRKALLIRVIDSLKRDT